MPRTSESGTERLARLECQRRGWEFHKASWVERFPPRKRDGRMVTIRRDLFGVLDAVAFPRRPWHGALTVGIQFTDRSSASKRVAKLTDSDVQRVLRRAGWAVVVWGFDPRTGALRELVADPIPE